MVINVFASLNVIDIGIYLIASIKNHYFLKWRIAYVSSEFFNIMKD